MTFLDQVYSNSIAATVWWAVAAICGLIFARKTWVEIRSYIKQWLKLRHEHNIAIQEQTKALVAHTEKLTMVADHLNTIIQQPKGS